MSSSPLFIFQLSILKKKNMNKPRSRKETSSTQLNINTTSSTNMNTKTTQIGGKIKENELPSLRAENKTTGKLQDFVACYTSNPTDSAVAIPLLPCSCCCGSEPTFLFALLSFTTPTSYSCW